MALVLGGPEMHIVFISSSTVNSRSSSVVIPCSNTGSSYRLAASVRARRASVALAKYTSFIYASMPPNVHGLKDVNEAVRPAAASPRKSPAEELADALQLGAYAAEDQKNERWKDARRGFFAAHSALQRLIQGRPDMPETQKFSLRQIADRYWESATSAGQALRQAAHGVDDALSNPTPTPSLHAGELTPGFGGKGHQLASDGPTPETTEDMRAKRIAALEKLLPAAAPAGQASHIVCYNNVVGSYPL